MIDDDDFRLFWDTGGFLRERKGYTAHDSRFDDTVLDELAKQECSYGYRIAINGKKYALTPTTSPADDAESIWTEEIDRLENASSVSASRRCRLPDAR